MYVMMHHKGKGKRQKYTAHVSICTYVAHGKTHAWTDGRMHARSPNSHTHNAVNGRLGRGRSTAGYADFRYSEARVDRRRCSTTFSVWRSRGRKDDRGDDVTTAGLTD